MSVWSRVAVLAAGAVVGAAVGRAARSEEGRRAVGELMERGRGQIVPARGPGALAERESRVGTRMLRVAQDIRAGMQQRESELRDQLNLPDPSQALARGLGRGTDPTRGPSPVDEPTVIDHGWAAPPDPRP